MAVNSKITDIRVAISLPSNRKIRMLRRALGPEACWALLELWLYCGANEQDGALIGWSVDDLESAANWEGTRGEFASHTVRIGLLDELNGGGYEVHDWAENQPWIARAQERSDAARRAIEARWRRSKAKHDTGSIRREYEGNTDAIPPSLPSPSLPSPSLPSPSGEHKTTRTRAHEAEPYRWAEFAAIYPPFRLSYTKAAMKWWRKHAKDDATVDAILAGVRAWLESEQWRGGIVPNCGKFLAGEVWRTPAPPRKLNRQEQLEAHNRAVTQQVLASIGGKA
jgi:hypothetical protein